MWDNSHQYFTGRVTVGHELMQLRKNQNFLPLTDHNSAATIHHSKRWGPQGKLLTGIWLTAVCTAACWVWTIRKKKLYILVQCVLCYAASLVQDSRRVSIAISKRQVLVKWSNILNLLVKTSEAYFRMWGFLKGVRTWHLHMHLTIYLHYWSSNY